MNLYLQDVRAQNVPTYRYLLNFPCRKVMIYTFSKKAKKLGVNDLDWERTCPEEHPKSEKESGFFSE